MSTLKQLNELGQAPWLDFVARGFLERGELTKLIEEDGLRGVTSNPAIFEKAIGHADEYDASLQRAQSEGDLDVMSLYESLAIEDIQSAADALRPLYEETRKHDGYVSLEVSPYLAMNVEETVAEGRRLWEAVGRENLMIKVPATRDGLPAIERLIGEGINVNVTLLFSQDTYEAVANGYLAGLERLAENGNGLDHVASVASFFVSRIDIAVDKLLDERIAAANDADTKTALEALKGRVAIANAKLAYQRYKRLFSGPRWKALEARGAQTQRLLWASTGVKSKSLRDTLYVEELIGPDTVNTIPPATMDAFRDHGRVRASLEENVEEAEQVMQALERANISIDEVVARLVEEGVEVFVEAADKLLAAVARKRTAILGPRLNTQTLALPADLQQAVDAELEDWRRDGRVRRLWQRDPSLWTGADEARWLGWLQIVASEREALGELERFAQEVRVENISDILLLGMGGSSLGPEVIAETLGAYVDGPALHVLDSTDPAQVAAFEARIDPSRTLFIVSSKSGGTLEPNILKQYFFEVAAKALGREGAGRRFVTVTDPGSKMEAVAKADNFAQVFHGSPEIGGRYSVLSKFGLVPAAAMGVDLERFLDAAAIMVHSCGAAVPPAENPGVILGVLMGVAARHGRDKITFLTSPALHDVGAWAEQLIAESTGKGGLGIIPVDMEEIGAPEVYGQDRLFVQLRLESEAGDEAVDALERAGHPVVRIRLEDPYSIGQEFFRWEIATAVAGAVMGVNPFDQPDVEAAKIETKKLTSAYEAEGRLPAETPFFEGEGVKLFADERNARELKGGSLAEILEAHLGRLRPGDYFALLAYVEHGAATLAPLQEIRHAVRDRTRVATCLGFGPRFLHSTGQAYKGGPGSGVFLQITCDDAQDLPVPGQSYTFGVVKAAQARGDFEVLAERGRRALRVHLGADVQAGLAKLRDAVVHAVSGSR